MKRVRKNIPVLNRHFEDDHIYLDHLSEIASLSQSVHGQRNALIDWIN